jgi:hypothetical protein
MRTPVGYVGHDALDPLLTLKFVKQGNMNVQYLEFVPKAERESK